MLGPVLGVGDAAAGDGLGEGPAGAQRPRGGGDGGERGPAGGGQVGGGAGVEHGDLALAGAHGGGGVVEVAFDGDGDDGPVPGGDGGGGQRGLAGPGGPDESDRTAVALAAGGPAAERVADAVFGGEELAVAGHPPEQHPPGGWDDVVDGEGSYVGGGGLAGLGVLPEAAAPAVAVEAPPHHDEPRERGRHDQRDDGGARPVEPRGRQPAGVGGPRSSGWLASGEAGGGAEPDVDPAVDAAAGERDGEPRSGPRREAGGEHQPTQRRPGRSRSRRLARGDGGRRGPWLGHCRIDTSTATAEAARRYGANGADLARLATVAMEATRRRAPRRRRRR